MVQSLIKEYLLSVFPTSGRSPHESYMGKWIANVVYIYLFFLFAAAGALANGAAGDNLGGFLIVALLVYSTYLLSTFIDCWTIGKALWRRNKRSQTLP